MYEKFKQYKESTIYSMSNLELLLLLYDEAVKRLKMAQIALEDKKYETFEECLEKAGRIVRYLIQILDMQYPISKDLKRIRHLADLYVFYRKTAAENQLQDLEDRLKEFKVNILAQKLLHLSYMWFGTREECASMETKEEELQVFDILEKNVFYGMTGKFGPETDEQALDLRSDILKEEEWENRMEKRALFYRRLREFFSLVRRQLKELYDETMRKSL